MDSVAYFFLILIATLAITKVALLKKSFHSPTIFGVRLHHWIYGVALIIAGAIVHNITAYAIGWALFTDQLPLIVTNKWRWEDSYSKKTLLAIMGLVLLLFIFRKPLLSIL